MSGTSIIAQIFVPLKYTSIGVHKKPSPRLATYLTDQLYFDRRDKYHPSMGSNDNLTDNSNVYIVLDVYKDHRNRPM